MQAHGIYSHTRQTRCKSMRSAAEINLPSSNGFRVWQNCAALLSATTQTHRANAGPGRGRPIAFASRQASIDTPGAQVFGLQRLRHASISTVCLGRTGAWHEWRQITASPLRLPA